MWLLLFRVGGSALVSPRLWCETLPLTTWLVDMLLGYDYMAVYGYGNEGKVEKSNKFSLLARCTARLRRVLIGLGPSFIKIGQVSFSLSSYYRYDAYIIL